MRKLKGSARTRAAQEAKRRLNAEGFEVLEHEAGAALKAFASSGRTYVYYPHIDKWFLGGGQPKLRRGLSAMIAAERGAEYAEAGREKAWRDITPRVTIFSDAGFCHHTKCASWGAWIKADGERSISSGGEMEELVTSSTEAEIRGGANALALAIGRGIVRKGDCIMWQCDNVAALSWLLALYGPSRDRSVNGVHARKPRPGRGPSRVCMASGGAKAFVALCEKHELRVLVRHVRGHQPGSHRQWVNRLCDGIAARHLKHRRARLAAPGLEKSA